MFRTNGASMRRMEAETLAARAREEVERQGLSASLSEIFPDTISASLRSVRDAIDMVDSNAESLSGASRSTRSSVGSAGSSAAADTSIITRLPHGAAALLGVRE